MKELKSMVFRIHFFPSFKNQDIFHLQILFKMLKFSLFWLHCVFIVAHGALCCCVQTFSWGTLASHCGDFSCRGAQTLGCTRELWCPDSVASCKWDPNSWARDRICAQCIVRQILKHWITREVPHLQILDTCLIPSRWLTMHSQSINESIIRDMNPFNITISSFA